MAENPVQKLAESTERYQQMLAANLAASIAAREQIVNEAPLSPVETALRAGDSNTGDRV